MFRPFLPIFGLLITAAAAANAQRINIVERWSTQGDPAIAEFGYIAGMAPGPNGTVWVADNLGHGRLIEIDRAGRVTRVVAEHGDGPGEVRNPTLMAPTPDGGLAVLDIGTNSIHLFGPSGGFQRRIHLGRQLVNPKGFAADTDGTFFLGAGMFRSEYGVHRFSADGELMESWHPVPTTQNPMTGTMVGGGPLVGTGDGTFLYSRAAPHGIFRYDGARWARLAADPDILRPIGDDFMETTGSGAELQQRPRWSFPQSRAIFGRPDGTIVNVIWHLERSVSVWQLYTSSGELIAQQAVARPYEPWAMMPDGRIVASYRDAETGEHTAVLLEMRR